MVSRLERGRWLLPISLLAFFAHADVLGHWFVASDTLPLIETSRISNPGDFVAIFTRPLMHGSDFADTALFYRPIASLSYAIDYALWGLTPFGYHLTTLVLHAIAVVLVAVVVIEITNRPGVGYLTAVLFAVHPVTVEVVPVTARRQDVLLTVFVLISLLLFVRWYRRVDHSSGEWRLRSRLLGGALAAYLLALGSKETAVTLPVLVTVWVVLQCGIDRPRRLVRTLIHTVGPFAALTVCYLVLRVAVLGGLGGYTVGSDPPAVHAVTSVFLFAVKYVLWLTYPLYAVEEGLSALSMGSVPLLVLVPVVLLSGAIAAARLAHRDYFGREHVRRLRLLCSVGGIVGFAALPLVVLSTSWFDSLITTADTGVLAGYVVGLLFVGGCIGIIVATTLVEHSPFDRTIWRQLAFFGCWAAVPFGLVATSGFVTSRPLAFGFGMRNGYFATIPAMAMLSLLALPTLREARERLRMLRTGKARWRSDLVDSNTVRAAAIVLLVVPLLATSPLVHTGSGWHAAGELNQQSLGGLANALEATPNEESVVIVDFPSDFDEQHRPYPHAHSVTPLRPYSLEAWLELHGHSERTQVRLLRTQTVREPPDELSFRTERRDGWIAVWTTAENRTPDDSGGG